MSQILINRQQIIKAQPTLSDVHVNRPLTNLSIAYIQEAKDFVAEQIFPLIPVDHKTDSMFTLDKGPWFTNSAKERAPGTESTGGGYSLNHDKTYNCIPYAHHDDIDDQIRYNVDMPLDLDRQSTLFVTQKLLLTKEFLFLSRFFRNGVWDKTYTGVNSSPVLGTSVYKWSDYGNSDPIKDITDAGIYVKQQTGFKPNTLVIAESVFRILKNHPDIVARTQYTTARIVTTDLLAALFEVSRVIVSSAVYNTADEGITPNMQFMAGNGALLAYVTPEPGILSRSAGYTFSWKGISGQLGFTTAVRRFRMEHLRSDRIEAEAAFDIKMVGSDLGIFFDSII
jgi:hypothetical protein